MKASMIAIDPADKQDALNALQLVEDINELVDDSAIEIRLKDGVPALYPKE